MGGQWFSPVFSLQEYKQFITPWRGAVYYDLQRMLLSLLGVIDGKYIDFEEFVARSHDPYAMLCTIFWENPIVCIYVQVEKLVNGRHAQYI